MRLWPTQVVRPRNEALAHTSCVRHGNETVVHTSCVRHGNETVAHISCLGMRATDGYDHIPFLRRRKRPGNKASLPFLRKRMDFLSPSLHSFTR